MPLYSVLMKLATCMIEIMEKYSMIAPNVTKRLQGSLLLKQESIVSLPIQPYCMVILLPNLLLQKSNIFIVYNIIVSNECAVHCCITVWFNYGGDHVLNNYKDPCEQGYLPKTRLNSKKNGIVFRMMVIMVDAVINGVIIIKAMRTKRRICLEWQMAIISLVTWFMFLWILDMSYITACD